LLKPDSDFFRYFGDPMGKGGRGDAANAPVVKGGLDAATK
jgi:hypothetical protein